MTAWPISTSSPLASSARRRRTSRDILSGPADAPGASRVARPARRSCRPQNAPRSLARPLRPAGSAAPSTSRYAARSRSFGHCSAVFPSDPSSIIVSMNRLTTEKRAQVIGSLVEGNSIRATVRMTGVAKNTVVKLLVDLGSACAEYQDRVMHDLPCKTLQCDEIWSFCLLSAVEFGHGGVAVGGHRWVGYERRSNSGRVWGADGKRPAMKGAGSWACGCASRVCDRFAFALIARRDACSWDAAPVGGAGVVGRAMRPTRA